MSCIIYGTHAESVRTTNSLIMKKKFIIPLLILGMSIGACQKPDDGPESGTQTPESGTQTPEQGQSPTYTIDIPTTENTSPVFDTEGGSVVLNFTASAEWTANIINTQADSWIDVSPKSGSTGAAKITITVEPNDTYDERSATVQIKCGSAEKNIVVTQKQKNVLTVTKSNFEVPAEGATIQIEVSSNVSIKVSLQADIDWVRETETKAMSANTYNFTVDANNSYETREATIIFEDEKSDLKQYVKIVQEGGTLTVHVPTKGGLQTVLTGIDLDTIKKLKITGILNDVDFAFLISRLPNLKKLDISGVELSILPPKIFAGSTNIEDLILPNTLTEIGEEMFYKSELKSITIPQNVRNIGPRAFYVCHSLTSVAIPASVETIEEDAFRGCTKLAVVTFEKESNLKMINNYAFYNCSLISIEIPSSIESIGKGAFAYCSDLESVVFEEGLRLTIINDETFDNCSLTSIRIPSSVEKIVDRAFAGCSLTSIRIPSSVEKIGTSAFSGCELETVTFEKGSRLKEIGDRIYTTTSVFGGAALASIEIPASVELIGCGAFKSCKNLKVVSFEKDSHLKIIGEGAFQNCQTLTSIEIPASVETIEGHAFYDCDQLTTVTFEEGSQLKTISGFYAFGALDNLATIDMSECAYVESIGNYAFENDKNLRLFLISTKKPPYCGVGTFKGLSSYSVLKVPSGSVDAYKAASAEWKNFSYITALDE